MEYTGIADPKGDPSGHQTKLVPRRPLERSKEDPGGRQKEVISRHQQKQRGILEKESPGIITTKYDPSRYKKEINCDVPEG